MTGFAEMRRPVQFRVMLIGDTERRDVMTMAAQDHAVLLDRVWKLVSVAREGSAPVDVSSRGVVFTFSGNENDDTIVVSQNRSITTIAEGSAGSLRFDRPFVTNLMLVAHLSRGDEELTYGQVLVGDVEYAISEDGMALLKAGTGELRFTS